MARASSSIPGCYPLSTAHQEPGGTAALAVFEGVSTSDFQEAVAALLGEQAQKALDTFLDTYRDKYPQAAQCLEKDREQLLTSHDFSAVH